MAARVRGVTIELPVRPATGEVWTRPMAGWPIQFGTIDELRPRLFRPWQWRKFTLKEIKQP